MRQPVHAADLEASLRYVLKGADAEAAALFTLDNGERRPHYRQAMRNFAEHRTESEKGMPQMNKAQSDEAPDRRK
ncbi:MAG: hypothetical protein R3C42_07360 [Parvularculaceae bacterium]